MLPKKTRYIWYAVLLLALSVVGTSAIANTKVYELFTEVTSADDHATAFPDEDLKEESSKTSYKDGLSYEVSSAGALNAPMFMTIIQGADEEVTCPNDGSTLAKFFLCGTSDVRTITLSQSGSSYQWQKLDPNRCALSVIEDCANTDNTCYDTVGTNATYDLDSAGEFRVRVDGGQYYYFKSSLNPLDPQLIKEDIICGNPGRVEITNVPAGYEYSLNNSAGPYQDDPFFDITTAGDYMVWVRLKNVSSSACLFPSNTVTVDDLDITVDVVANDILCSGELGSIDVSVAGVPGFYTYRLIKSGVTVDTFGPDAASNYTFANVSAGVYSIRVETNKCNELVTLDINSDPIEIGNGISPLSVSATANDSFGCGAASVDVDIVTSGGTSPYRYSLDGGTNWSAPYTGTATFTVTSSGTYNILVEDANGCTKTASVNVEDLPPPVYTITTLDANCGGTNDGSITVNVTNGFGYNLEFSIDNGSNYQGSNVFNGLAPGNYDVMVRYQQGSFVCTTPASSETVGTPTVINGTATPDSVPTCLNENGGQITISGVSGGTPPYEYSIGAGFSGTTVFTNLGVGTYTPQIRDANGCIVSLAPIVFNPLDKPTDMDFAISSLDCLTSTASVTVTVTDGTPPYTYEIVAPASAVINNGNNPVFTGLGLGTYTFRVTDNEGCSYDEAFAITDISSIGVQAQTVNVVTCVGDSDGEGRYLVDGFATTYSYQIDAGPVFTGQTNGIIDLTGLTAGSYVITVTDEDTNCTDTATLTIQEPATALAISSLSVTDMSCQNNNTGAVTVNTVGGWGGNRYTLTQPDASTRGPQSSPTFTNLTQDGLYTVSVEDANGCTVTDTFTLTSLVAPTLSVDNAATDYCYDNVDAATIVVNSAGGLPPYQYRINSGLLGGSNSFAGLTPGTYFIEVQDANDCWDDITVVIEPELTATATTIQELDCGGPPAQIQVNISNGYTSGGDYDIYEVSIDGAPYTSNSNNITGNSFIYSIPNDGSITVPTTFQFLVQDFEGCTTETNVVTISPPETIVGTAVPTHTTCGDDNGIITLVPDTNFGVPPYEFSDDSGGSWSTQNIYSGFAPGTYSTFMIRDSRGCTTALLSATINASAAVDATVVPVDAVCTAGTVEGSIDVTAVVNGTANYTYILEDINGATVSVIGPTASTTVSFPNLVPGTYTVITRDDAGCEDRDTVTIIQNQLDLIPVSTTTPPDCTTDFTYVVDIVGGTPPYLIGLVGDPLVSPNVDADTHDFTGQIAYGVTYFVEVVDALGCRYIEQIDPIPGPSPITVTATATTASCQPGGNGQIDYQVTGIGSPADMTIELQDTNTGATVVGPLVLNNEPIPYKY